MRQLRAHLSHDCWKEAEEEEEDVRWSRTASPIGSAGSAGWVRGIEGKGRPAGRVGGIGGKERDAFGPGVRSYYSVEAGDG